MGIGNVLPNLPCRKVLGANSFLAEDPGTFVFSEL